jgi:hypothetical protein
VNLPVLTLAQGRRQKRALMADIAREEKRKLRAHLADLRQQIRAARSQRKAALHEGKRRCRAERVAARERARAMRERALSQLREAIVAERVQAQRACSARMADARRLSERIHRTRAELEAERSFQREMRRIERANRERSEQAHRASATERRGESDDAVTQSLPPEYLPLWESIKGTIRGSERMSRLEVFLKWIEDHPDEHFAALDDKTDALIRELEAKQQHATSRLRDSDPPPAEPQGYEDVFAGL